MRQKENYTDLVQELTDLINSCNLSKELTAIVTRIFNEFDPHPTENEAYGVGEGNPNELRNNFSKQEEYRSRMYFGDPKTF